MPKSRIILSLGIFVALLPVLGFPYAWESFFEVAAGLTIVLLSVLISVDRRLMYKAKAQKRQMKRRAIVEAATEAALEYPQAFGRRAADRPGRMSAGRRASDQIVAEVEMRVLNEEISTKNEDVS